MDAFPFADNIGTWLRDCASLIPEIDLGEWDIAPAEDLPGSELIPVLAGKFPHGEIKATAWGNEQVEIIINLQEGAPTSLQEIHVHISPSGIQDATWESWDATRADISANPAMSQLLRCLNAHSDGALKYSLLHTRERGIDPAVRAQLLSIM